MIFDLLSLDDCPNWYYKEEGDIPGDDQFGGGVQTSMHGCGAMCNDTHGCCSFEYSYTSQFCNLNKDCQPTANASEDYHFCIRMSDISMLHCKTHFTCIQLYCVDFRPGCMF